ncbi:hypothetical protein FSARC_4789 [Fusarium sarcochroum]|uniref:Ankyrin n=1 Tax=Fusarium sarcochroum TaxID=1208366 RepID=A0A8H4XA91_9HYPO|nr:hypothetical protein FSARC_4789 [Fusarium sarcochroum]
MADPLSIAASIAGIISLTDTVFRHVFRYSRTASGAKEEVQQLSDEINSFASVLRSLHAVACHLEAEGQEFESALRVEHLSQCERTFQKIERRVKKTADRFNASRLQGLVQQMKWPYSVLETKDLLADISRYKDTISLAASADNMQQLQLLLSKQAENHDKTGKILSKTLDKVEISTHILLDNQKKDILAFFMKPDGNPQPNLDQSIKWRQPLTGTWLLESEELEQWFTTPGSRLWLKGIPGGGKTILAGAVIQEALTRSSSSNSSLGVAFYFCDYKDDKTHSPINILGAIAYQLALQRDDAFELLEAYHKILHPRRALSQSPDVDDLRATIQKMTETFDQAFIIIDGVDECVDDVEDVARALKDLADDADTTSIAVFSRDEEEIRAELEYDFTKINIAARTEDVETYIRTEMKQRESRGQPIVNNASVQEKIESELVTRARGMFRWVACQLDYLSELGTDSDRLEALDDLPPTLHDSYLRILRRLSKLPAKTQSKVQLCLQILAFFPIPLPIKELCAAVSTPEKLGARLEHIVDESFIARKCSSLIRKSADGRFFEFAHFTVQEFLADETLLAVAGFAPYRISRSQDQPAIGLLCLKFIQLENFDVEPSEVSDILKVKLGPTDPLTFYHFAAMQWPRLTADGLNNTYLLGAAKSLFRPNVNGRYYLWAFKFTEEMSFWAIQAIQGQFNKSKVDERFSGDDGLMASVHPLHIAAALNLPEVCSFLIQQGANVGKPSHLGTPLDLSQASFLNLYHWYSSLQRLIVDIPRPESEFLRLISPCSERRNATLACLLEAGATLSNDRQFLFLDSMVISCHLQDFSSTITLLSSGFVPPQDEIEKFGGCVDLWWTLRQHSSRLESALERFNEYLQQSSALNGNWGFELRKIIWSAAVAMELPFTKDPHRTDTRISLSSEALKTQVVYAIAEDNSQALTTYLNDGRIDLSEIGYSRANLSETLLHLAVRRNAVNCVSLLLDKGGDPYIKNSFGYDAVLLTSGSMDMSSILNVFVRHGVSLLSTIEGDLTIWHLAAEMLVPDSQFLNILFTSNIQETQQGLLMKSKDGRTPLAVALSVIHNPTNPDPAMERNVLAFINHCNDVPCFWDAQEPVFPLALSCGSKAIVQKLLELRDNPKTSGLADAKPLHHLAPSVSWQWVEYLKSLFPGATESRYLGRLSIESYVDACLRAGEGPNNEVLDQLAFDGLFRCQDENGTDSWTFICSAYDRFEFEVLSKNYTAFKAASAYFLSHGCIEVYEDTNSKCALAPFISLLARWPNAIPWPYDVVDNQVLSEAITTSRLWDSKSQLSIRFLKRAIWNCHQQTIKVLLEHEVDIHHPVDNTTVIQFACLQAWQKGGAPGWKDTMKLVLSHSDSEGLNGFSSIHPGLGLIHYLAHPNWAEAEATWMIDQLVANGADINGVDEQLPFHERTTPLVHHITVSSFLCAETLLDKGANPNGEDALPGTGQDLSLRPVHACVLRKNVSLLRKMLQVSRETDVSIDWEALYLFSIKVDDMELIGPMTGFQMVCYTGFLEAFNFFLEEDLINIELKTGGGLTPLHLAAMRGHETIVTRLVQCGHEVMALDDDDYTPLHFAVQNRHLAVTRALIQLGARDSITGFSQNALNSLLNQLKSAIEGGILEDCRDLQAEGCPLDGVIPGTNGLSPLIYSMECGELDITDWLLDQGASTVQYCYRDGVSPITAMDFALGDDDLAGVLPAILRRFTDQGGNWEEIALHSLSKAIRNENDPGLRTVLAYLDKLSSEKPPFQQILPRILARSFGSRKENTDSRYTSPILNDAMHGESVEVARLLLEYGAAVDLVDSDGDTPLACTRSREMAELLVHYGASVTPLFTESIPNLLERWEGWSVGMVETLARVVTREEMLASLKWLDWSPTAIFHPLETPKTTIGSLMELKSMGLSSDHTWKTGSYLFGLEYGDGLEYILNSDDELGDMEPFPWNLYGTLAFARMTFLGTHFRHVRRRFGSETLQRFANLNPEKGWSPLCRAASQNAIDKMENCLSLGADIEFEGCPLGSALMIASVCGQLPAVKLLIRKGAKVCYTGRHGFLSVFSVARSKSVKSWLLAGRFYDQTRIKQVPEDEPDNQTRPWSGFAQARHKLHGFEYIREDEARIDYAKRLAWYKKKMRGRVAPYIEGLVYDRHQGSFEILIR